MTHLDDDRLLQFVLQTLGEGDYEEARQHVAGCDLCGRAVRMLRTDIERIAGLHLQVEMPEPPVLPVHAHETFRMWRWVAAVAAGFLVGFLTAVMSIDSHPNPVPQRLVPTGASASRAAFVPCQALEVSAARN
jgi:hypothetical protein